MKVYVLRGQGIGVIYDRIYFRWPTPEQIEAAMAYELERHGVSPEGKPIERWVRVQTLELVGFTGEAPAVPDGVKAEHRGAFSAEVAAEHHARPVSVATGAFADIGIQGTAMVTPAGE